MNKLFRNKYRIKSIRLQNWDYASEGFYFITICTYKRMPYFGEIINGKMKLSEIGVVVHDFWLRIERIRTNIKLDVFVIMPNHIHGIIIVKFKMPVETCHGMSLPLTNAFSKPIAGSISIIINQYKSAVKRHCNKNNHPNFQWQPRFYESIIRNEEHLNNVRNYIFQNPVKWEFDRNDVSEIASLVSTSSASSQ